MAVSIADLAGVNLGSLANVGAEFDNLDSLIRGRSPAAKKLIREGTDEQLRLSGLAAREAIDPLRQFAGLDAFNEQQALLGTLGADAQELAIGSIPVSQFDQELQRRQSQGQLRGASAAGELGSGATLLGAQQLAGGQMAEQIQKRLGQLEPLTSTARGIRSTISGLEESAGAREAQLNLSEGQQLGSIELGAGAQSASSQLQRAELSGLQGIAKAQQQAQQANQLASLAGQFAPQIGGMFQSQPTAVTQTGQSAFIPEAGNVGFA